MVDSPISYPHLYLSSHSKFLPFYFSFLYRLFKKYVLKMYTCSEYTNLKFIMWWVCWIYLYPSDIGSLCFLQTFLHTSSQRFQNSNHSPDLFPYRLVLFVSVIQKIKTASQTYYALADVRFFLYHVFVKFIIEPTNIWLLFLLKFLRIPLDRWVLIFKIHSLLMHKESPVLVIVSKALMKFFCFFFLY